MSSALLAVPTILAPLQALWRWLVPAIPELPSTLRGRSTQSSQQLRHDKFSKRPIAGQRSGALCQRPTPGRALAHRPLRIVRVMEAGQAPTQVGRMVISGRMADVCAELDRLAACEAALY